MLRLLSDDPLTLQEIGDHYGVTREAVRQIEARLMSKIRAAMSESLTQPHPTIGSRAAADEQDDD